MLITIYKPRRINILSQDITFLIIVLKRPENRNNTGDISSSVLKETAGSDGEFVPNPILIARRHILESFIDQIIVILLSAGFLFQESTQGNILSGQLSHVTLKV